MLEEYLKRFLISMIKNVVKTKRDNVLLKTLFEMEKIIK